MTEANSAPELKTADIARIMKLLPHRYPFLLIDRMYDMNGEESGVALKNVTMNEPFFQGHFPGRPVMPGVLLVEAMAQAAGALVLNHLGDEHAGKLVFFMSIDKARFRKPVEPGVLLRMAVKLVRRRDPVWKFEGQAFVGDQLCAEAEFSAMISTAG